jgi:hypothetical protein
MEQSGQLRMLLDLAEQIGLEVRRVPGASNGSEHPGGAMVKLKGREILFLDPAASPSDQLGVLAASLRGRRQVEDRFLPPEIREIIDTADEQA